MFDESIKEEVIDLSKRQNDTPFIVELKKDDTPQNSIKQIREKEYVQKFRKE